MNDYQRERRNEWRRFQRADGWKPEESDALDVEIEALRNRKGGSLSGRAADSSGDLVEACRKIMAYKTKTSARRKPRVSGLAGSGESWRG